MFEALWLLCLVLAIFIVLGIILKRILTGAWPSPAGWSAIAACFAALSSFLMMEIQRENLMEAARPEIVLTHWTRGMEGRGEAADEIITFKTIKNVGHGAAFNLIINAASFKNKRPLTLFSTTRLPVLAANESVDINGKISIWLKNVEPDNSGFKLLQFPIEIFCWDSRGRRYETRYSLSVAELSGNVLLDNEIAPGVSLENRTTNIRSVRFLKMLDKLRRVPVVGKLFSEVRYLRHNHA